MIELQKSSIKMLNYEELAPPVSESIVGHSLLFPDEDFHYASSGFLDIGYTFDELKSHSHFDLVAPDDRSIVKGRSKKVYKGNLSLLALESTGLEEIANNSEQKQKEINISETLKELRNLKFALDEAATVSITDLYGRIIYVNDKFCEVSGYSREELIGKTHKVVNSGYHPQDFYQRIWSTIMSGETWKGEILNKPKNGSKWWADVTITPFLNNNGELHQFIAIRSDITERKAMEEEIKQQKEELRQSEARFRSLVQNSHEMISICDNIGIFRYTSPSAKRISGFNIDELIGKSIFDFVHPDELSEAKEVYQEVLLKPGKSVKTILRLIHANSTWRYYELILTNLFYEKSINGITGNIRDITETKNAENQIHYMAYNDHLTGLPNRRFFEEQLTKEVNYASENSTCFSLMFLDLDSFKLINDSLGHEIGDKLLQEVAHRLKSGTTKKDMVARQGGDEFTIIIRNFRDMEHITQISQQVLQLFEQPFIVDNYELFITTSIGVSVYPDNGKSEHELVKNADLAMYLAKEQGKNNYQIYSSTLNVRNKRLFSLQNDLRKALQRNEFALHYQPIIEPTSNKIIGAEALIRWNHPVWGMVSPTEFIPIAEESGLIVKIGEWVLFNACKQAKTWQDAGLMPIKMAVNFSTLQFLQSDIIERIDNILLETALEPKWLEIEITETTLIKSESHVLDKMQNLKAKGIRIAIDDFGTGYSSLSYLKRFKVNTLKVDRSFINDMLVDSDSKEITSTIIQLAKKMNITTVAEGIETVDQLGLLKGMNCDEIQGYLYSKPVKTEEFERLLKKEVCLPNQLII